MIFALALLASTTVLFGLLWYRASGQVARVPEARNEAEAQAKAAQKLEAELEKRRKEFDEQKTQVNELKAEVKQLKKKLHDQKEADKDGNDLAKAREQVERQASIQLEHTRAELAAALAEVEKLKADAETSRRRASSAPAAAAQPAPQRIVRELSEAEKERIERLEHQSGKDRARAAELDREVKRLKGRLDSQTRLSKSTGQELSLLKDKFKALEKRLNRTLLERDLLRRAIKDLEQKSGVAADRTELTAEEVAASDKKVEEMQLAQERAEEARRATPPQVVESPADAAPPPPADEAPASPPQGQA